MYGKSSIKNPLGPIKSLKEHLDAVKDIALRMEQRKDEIHPTFYNLAVIDNQKLVKAYTDAIKLLKENGFEEDLIKDIRGKNIH